MLLKDFNETFADELRDPDFAAAYLQAALEDEGVEAFLLALRDVAQANGEAAEPAEADGREFKALNSVLHTYGMRFAILRGENATAQG